MIGMSADWTVERHLTGKPAEIASVALFLAGPGASFVTGQAFGPNGGSVMP